MAGQAEDEMQPDDKTECTRILLEIQAAGGPDKATPTLISEATARKLVAKAKGGMRYTLKGNRLRGDLLLEFSGMAPSSSDLDGKVVDAQIGKHTVRGKVSGKVGDLVRIDHHHSGGKQPIAVSPDSVTEVGKDTL